MNGWTLRTALALSLFACLHGCVEGGATDGLDGGEIDAGTGSETEALAEPGPPYPVCMVGRHEMCPAIDADGHRGNFGWRSEDGCREACQCWHGCETVLACPVPETGSAYTECVGGTCVIECGPGLVCPAGMACVSEESRGVRWCMWVTERACEPDDEDEDEDED